jgi:hypothetical protein
VVNGSPRSPEVADPRREQSLGGEIHARGPSGATRAEPGGSRTSGRSPDSRELKALRGGKALKENPKSVTRLKHGGRVLEDVNRQEGEKP